MNYSMQRSGAYIQSLRVQNGYTQGELAKALNIDQSFLSRIEAGQKGCSVDMFVQLSKFFQVPLNDLILGPEQDVSQEAEYRMRLKANITELIDQLAQLRTQL
ncbi:MAG: helix-turn-helix domain-containing protein [Oscillospiraceae bacterium]|nr:helix-turn-helix domain-containing protein [Oscillospiraceae bacterium]